MRGHTQTAMHVLRPDDECFRNHIVGGYERHDNPVAESNNRPFIGHDVRHGIVNYEFFT